MSIIKSHALKMAFKIFWDCKMVLELINFWLKNKSVKTLGELTNCLFLMARHLKGSIMPKNKQDASSIWLTTCFLVLKQLAACLKWPVDFLFLRVLTSSSSFILSLYIILLLPRSLSLFNTPFLTLLLAILSLQNHS